MIWAFLVWAAIGITSFAIYHMRDSDELVVGDALFILIYGTVIGPLIPLILAFYALSDSGWLDRPIYRKKR